MNKKDRKYVQETVESEGFEYAFLHYSDFDEVQDAKFHELRQAFVKAAKELAEYVEIEGF